MRDKSMSGRGVGEKKEWGREFVYCGSRDFACE